MKRLLVCLPFVLLSVMLVGSQLQAQDAAKPELRTWKDSTGQFSIEAVFVRVSGDQVVLQGADKKELVLPLAKLSAADRQYLQQRLAPMPNGKSAEQAGTAKAELRIWTDSTGDFSIEAIFVRINGDQVVLQGADKKELVLPLAKLSEADRQYLKKASGLRKWTCEGFKSGFEAVFVRVDDNRLVLRFPGETFPQNTTWATGKPDELSLPLYKFKIADRQFILTSTGTLAMPERRFSPGSTAGRKYYMGELNRFVSEGTALQKNEAQKLIAAIEVARKSGLAQVPSHLQTKVFQWLPLLTPKAEANEIIFNAVVAVGGKPDEWVFSKDAPEKRQALIELFIGEMYGSSMERKRGETIIFAITIAQQKELNSVRPDFQEVVAYYLPRMMGKSKAAPILARWTVPSKKEISFYLARRAKGERLLAIAKDSQALQAIEVLMTDREMKAAEREEWRKLHEGITSAVMWGLSNVDPEVRLDVIKLLPQIVGTQEANAIISP